MCILMFGHLYFRGVVPMTKLFFFLFSGRLRTSKKTKTPGMFIYIYIYKLHKVPELKIEFKHSTLRV